MLLLIIITRIISLNFYMFPTRISKALSKLGVCSRREAENLILQRKIKINNVLITSPVNFVDLHDVIHVDNILVSKTIKKIRLWKYYKPTGVITSHRDNFNRTTLFQLLPKSIGRVISVGRLDYNTEGLILLTNNGNLSRKLELPSTYLSRIYLCRAYGNMPRCMVDELSKGITVDNINYAPMLVERYKKQGANSWYTIKLYEGKNNEIRKVFGYFSLQVNRLIRTHYADFSLDNMSPKTIMEISYQKFKKFCES